MKTTTFLLGLALVFSAKATAQLGSGWEWAAISGTATAAPGRQLIDIATDSDNNVYGTGRFLGTLTLGSQSVSTSGDGSTGSNYDEDAFIVKYNTAGQVQWLKKFGIATLGSNQLGQIVTTDASGNVYVGGAGMANANANSAFLLKYDTNGNLLWSKTDFPLYEVGGINISPDGNLIVMESNQGSKNIHKINAQTGAIIWTVTNTGAGSNGASRYQDFVDAAGNIYYTCFIFSAGAATVAGQSITTTGLASFIASVDNNGQTRWVQTINNAQVQLGYTIDSAGKSYIQLGGGFGDTFQGYSTNYIGGSRYFELGNDGLVTRALPVSPYFGKFRVKSDGIYAFSLEQGGYGNVVTYGGQNFQAPALNTDALGIVMKYDKSTGNVVWSNTFNVKGMAWVSGDIYTIETAPSGKVIVGGDFYTSVKFGDSTFATAPLAGINPSDMFIAQTGAPFLNTEDFSKVNISVYPNPASDVVHFNIHENAIVKIYNISGQLVSEKAINSTDNHIDVSAFSRGMYLAEITVAGKISQKSKFIKK